MSEHDKNNPEPLKPLYDPVAGHAPAALVTGPTGAIGRVVCRELVQNGYRVLGIVRSSDQSARLPYAVVPIQGDIRDPSRWDAAITRADVVIHAAIPPAPKGPKDRAYAVREAEELAAILGGIATAVRKKKKRLIVTSSALVFEPNKDGWVTESSGYSEGKGYGIRQRRIYRTVQEQRKKGLKAIVMCPAYVYGPGGWFEKSLLEPMSRGESRMVGEGNQTMHYVEGSDVGRAYRLAIEHGVDGDDYLIGDDRPSTHGAFTRLGVTDEFAVLAEADLLTDSSRASLGYVGYLQGDYEFIQGLHGIVTMEWQDQGQLESDHVQGKSKRPGAGKGELGFWVGANWFFLPHLDIRTDAIIRPDDFTLITQLHPFL